MYRHGWPLVQQVFALSAVRQGVPLLLCAFRYFCSSCFEAGKCFNLCQTCWDKFQQQQQAHSSQLLHPADHSFCSIGPRMSRHNDGYYDQLSGSSGWPRATAQAGGAGGAYGRALKRLEERTGVRF